MVKPDYVHPIGKFALNILQSTAPATKNYQHEVDIGKIIAVPVVFFIVLLSCLLPQVLIRVKKHANLIIQFLTCVAGGALLSIGLLHIIPHARENFELYEGGSDDHAHFHMQAAPQTILRPTFTPTMPPLQRKIAQNHTFTQSNILASVTPQKLSFDPHERFYPQQTTVSEESVHDHGFPWTELCCGLVILLLMCVEGSLHLFLSKRKSSVHLHEHGGDNSDCSHNHNAEAHNSGHSHGHSHHHHDHSLNSPDHLHHVQTPALDEEECAVIELTTTDPSGVPDQSPPHVTNSSRTPTPEHSHSANAEQNLTPEQKALAEHKKSIDAYVSCFAISLHCIFNGMALGAINASTSNAAAQFWTFFGATIGHKICDALAVAIPLARSNLNKVVSIIIILSVSFATPLGIIIGYFSTTTHTSSYLAQAILLALSSGSFFYISMLELIPSGVQGSDFFILKWLLVGLGFAIPAIIAKFA